MKNNRLILSIVVLIAITFAFGCKKKSYTDETQLESLTRRGFKLTNHNNLFNTFKKGDSITLLKKGAENSLVSESIHSYTKYSIDAGSCIMSGQMAMYSNDYVDDLGNASQIDLLSIKLNLPGITQVTYTGDAGEQHNNYISLYNGTVTFYWDDSDDTYFSKYYLQIAEDVCPDGSFKKI